MHFCSKIGDIIGMFPIACEYRLKTNALCSVCASQPCGINMKSVYDIMLLCNTIYIPILCLRAMYILIVEGSISVP
jgi:hypothetical protein